MTDHIYTSSLIKKAEKKTFEKIDSFKVMQRAAKACSNYIIKNYSSKKIIVICGSGNNGGDGLLIAKHLINKNFIVHVYYPFSQPKTKDSIKAFSLFNNKSHIIKKPLLRNYDLIIDAIFGTGLKKKLDKKIIKLFKFINKLNSNIISIDMPSGVNTDDGYVEEVAIKAKTTLTFHRYKPGQWLLPGKEYCGKVKLMDIKLVNLDVENNLKLNYPNKPPLPSLTDHKFTRGSCIIIAGENLVGAAKLAFFGASQSALRVGSGLCKLIVKESQINIFKPHILEEMLVSYKNIKDLQEIIKSERNKVIIFGCGVDNNYNNQKILKFLLKQPVKLVLDAVVFSMMSKNRDNYLSLLKSRNTETIMTPHAGEFKRLFKSTNNKIYDTINAAKKSNSIIVYKGNDTVIGSPKEGGFINSHSSPYLATAGSGDVLSGLIGGFLAQKLDTLHAAQLGCYVHSQCGINLNVGLTAGDLIKEIPKVLKSFY